MPIPRLWQTAQLELELELASDLVSDLTLGLAVGLGLDVMTAPAWVIKTLGTAASPQSTYVETAGAGGATAGTLRHHRDPLVGAATTSRATGAQTVSTTTGTTGAGATGFDTRHDTAGHTGTQPGGHHKGSTIDTGVERDGKAPLHDKIKDSLTEMAGKLMKDPAVIEEGQAIKSGQHPPESGARSNGMYVDRRTSDRP